MCRKPRVKQGPEYSGTITGATGPAALTERRALIKGITVCAGCITETRRGAAVPNTGCELWKTETWNYVCGQTSGFDPLLSMAWTVHVGIGTDLVIVHELIF